MKRLFMFLLACCATGAAHAQTISNLPAGTALTGVEMAPFVQSGVTVKITADQLETFVSAAMVAAANTWALDQSVPDEAYNTAAWDGSLEIPTKNAVRDALEALIVSGVSDGDKGDITVSGSGTVWDIDSNASISGALPLITITGTDPGAVGPILKFLHDSATPAAGDVAFDLQVYAGADDEQIGRIAYRLTDGSTSSEDGFWDVYADIAGTETRLMSIGGGNVDHRTVIIGVDGAPLTNFFATTNAPATLQILGHDSEDASLAVVNTGDPAYYIAARSRGSGAHDYTALQSGDAIGAFSWQGADGDGFVRSAAIFANVDAAVGNNDMPGRLVFEVTEDGESQTTIAAWINNAGQFVLGETGEGGSTVYASGWSAAGLTPHLQVLGTTQSTGSLGLFVGSASGAGPVLALGKSRDAAIDYTVVQSTDDLGTISFQGSDNTNMMVGATISAFVQGTPGDGTDLPTALMFATTPDSSETPIRRLLIHPSGNVIVGNNNFAVGRGSLGISDAVPVSGAGGQLQIYEDSDNGNNYKGLRAPAAVTADTDCLFEDDANFIPDSCVGDGSDASDARLKTGFKLASETGLIDQIKVYDFEWNVDAPQIAEAVRKGKPGIGVKAQELYEIAPDLVHVGGADPLSDPWTWKPEKLVPYLIVEIQQLRKRVAELERR